MAATLSLDDPARFQMDFFYFFLFFGTILEERIGISETFRWRGIVRDGAGSILIRIPPRPAIAGDRHGRLPILIGIENRIARLPPPTILIRIGARGSPLTSSPKRS